MAGGTISAVIITKDEEDRVPRALASLGFADEVIVLDTGSSDRTVEVCRETGARVEQAEWRGYVEAKNAAAGLASSDWVLSLDADEEVTPELRAELERIAAGDGEAVGYYIPRRNHYLGRWVRRCGWYPDYQLRFWRRGLGSWTGGRVHESVKVDGPTARARGALNHFTYESTEEHLLRMNRYAELSALDKHERGEKAGFLGLMFAAPWQFFRLYFLRGGLLDGVTGLVVSAMGAHYAFLKKLKLWEMQRSDSGADEER